MRTYILAIAIAFGALCSTARAAVPSEISVQGVLRNNAGQLQTMPVDLTIQFFDAATGGNSIVAPITLNAVPVTNGLFNVQIADPTLATKLGNATAVWVEVTVNNTDVFPRQKVTSEVFALRSAVAEGLSCSGCVTDAMVAGVAAAKVTGKVASAAAADTATTATTAGTANALSCTGCVTNAMVMSIDGGKVTGTVASATNAATAANATQLGGVAATSYQRALGGTGACPANQAITGIAQSGTFTCTNTVANANIAVAADSLSTACATNMCVKDSHIESVGAAKLNGTVQVNKGGTGLTTGANLISAWALVKVATNGTITIINNYNIGSITSNGTFLQVSFTNALRTANYVVITQDGRPDSGGFPSLITYTPDFYNGQRDNRFFLLRSDSVANWGAPPRELTFSILVVGG